MDKNLFENAVRMALDEILYPFQKKEDGTYAVWTAWNESSQSLNFGHYNLKSIEDCEKVFEEFYFKG